MIRCITNTLRTIFVGKEQNFTFRKVDPSSFTIPMVSKTNLYIHIPFCKSMCPYCPYNRVSYNKEQITSYIKSLLREIEKYSDKLGKIEIGSVYIGGGTPTNAIDELGIIIKTIKEKFIIIGDIAIETTIADIKPDIIRKMESYGINMISVGVQSFDNKYLEFLGRNYRSEAIKPAITLLKKSSIKNINIDLMFALPEQTQAELSSDLKNFISLQVDQVTTYPLFTFPYSDVADYIKVSKLKTPNIFIRRKYYKFIHDYLSKRGYQMSSVWSFNKTDSQYNKRYSSVTRENYMGLGAGSASRFENTFYFNTFSIPEYESRLSQNRLPIAINMNITPSLSKYYWFYWRLYDTEFNQQDIKKLKDYKINTLIKLFHLLGFSKRSGEIVSLTERGSFWIHLAQNYFMLDYINKVWSVMKNEPFPEKITI
ncbi:radical SAM protein [Candidatus Dojkabacteria bacterium]|nr:radical SAM protein [Candidatus Dojkabacteria bacterium]